MFFVKTHETVAYEHVQPDVSETAGEALVGLPAKYRGSSEVTAELESLALEVGPALPALAIRDGLAGAGLDERWFGLVMDKDMPARAEPGATVRLGLEEIADDDYAGLGFRLVDEVSETVDIDHERAQVLWTATNGFDLVATHRGDHWDFPLDRAGEFSIQATFDTVAAEGSSDACSGPTPYYSSFGLRGSLDAYWEEEFTVAVEEGPPATIEVGRVPVEPVDRPDAYTEAQITARWTFERTGSPLEDQGNPRFHTPSGATLPSGDAFWANEAGHWSVAWEATGQRPPANDNLPSLPLVEGEDVTLTVRVDYD